jgi:adenosine kinase
MLSLSAPFIPQFFKEPLGKTAPYWDYVIGNEAEALAWAESQGLITKSIPEIAKALVALPKINKKRNRSVIITQGTDPTVVATGTPDGKVLDVKEFIVHTIDPKEIVDTTGAGLVISIFRIMLMTPAMPLLGAF